MGQPFQFSIRALLQTTAGLALLLALCGLGWQAQLTYTKLLLYPVLLLAAVVLLFLPACGLAHKLGQCLVGRLPPDESADAEPIRFDPPPPNEEHAP